MSEEGALALARIGELEAWLDRVAGDHARLLLALQAERLEANRYADELRSELGVLLRRVEALERNPLR